MCQSSLPRINSYANLEVESHPYNKSMDGSTGNANERIRHAGRHNLGTRSVSRMGYGAVRLTGPHVFGPPGDQARALSVCERPPAAKLDTTRRLQQALKRGPLRSQADLHRSTGDGIGEDNAAYGRVRSNQVITSAARWADCLFRVVSYVRSEKAWPRELAGKKVAPEEGGAAGTLCSPAHRSDHSLRCIVDALLGICPRN